MNDLGNAFRIVAGEYEPHVEAVLPAVVVRHFGEAVDDAGNRIEAWLWNLQRRQQQRAAHPFGMIQGTKPRQHTVGQQPPQALDQLLSGQTQLPGSLLVGRVANGETLLQHIDDPAIHVIHRPAPAPYWHDTGRRAA